GGILLPGRGNSRPGGGTKVERPLYLEHPVDLFDGAAARKQRLSLLVSALHHEGSRIHRVTDRARGTGWVLDTRADRRFANIGSAPSRHQERLECSAQVQRTQYAGHGSPSWMVETADVRQVEILRKPGRHGFF